MGRRVPVHFQGAAELDLALAHGIELAAQPVDLEDHLGIALAFQNLLVHLAVAPVVAVLALVASMTMRPLAVPVSGSRWRLPSLTRIVPSTVCRVAPKVNVDGGGFGVELEGHRLGNEDRSEGQQRHEGENDPAAKHCEISLLSGNQPPGQPQGTVEPESRGGRVRAWMPSRRAKSAGSAARARRARRRSRGRRSRPEHHRRHEVGQAIDAPVGGGIAGEIAARQGLDQRGRLVEGDGQAFAGDGIQIAGGIAHQGDAASGHGAHPLPERPHAAVTGGGRVRPRSSLAGPGTLQEAVEAGLVPAPEDGDPNFVPAHRRHVGFALRPPIDLDAVAPGRQGEMPADTEAARRARRSVQTGPAPAPGSAGRPPRRSSGRRERPGPSARLRPSAPRPSRPSADRLRPPAPAGRGRRAARCGARPAPRAGKVPLGHEGAVEIANAAQREAPGLDADLPQGAPRRRASIPRRRLCRWAAGRGRSSWR